jgi:hypothetical protein
MDPAACPPPNGRTARTHRHHLTDQGRRHTRWSAAAVEIPDGFAELIVETHRRPNLTPPERRKVPVRSCHRIHDARGKIPPQMLPSFLPRALRKTLWTWWHLASGRHEVSLWAIPTVAGSWAWRAQCRTCGVERTGRQDTRAAAVACAQALVGARDEHRLYTKTKLTKRVPVDDLTRAGDALLAHWNDLTRVKLSEEIRGDGFTIATDASLNPATGAAAWAYVTDAGWCRSGRLASPRITDSQGAELVAVYHALYLYPDGSDVTLLLDNRQVGLVVQSLAEAVASGGRVRDVDLPPWADPGRAGWIAHNIQRLSSLQVLWVRSNTNRLHRHADTLARTANGYPPKKPRYAIAASAIEGTSGPMTTLLARADDPSTNLDTPDPARATGPGTPGRNPAVVVNELSQRAVLTGAGYDFTTTGPPHAPSFTCTVQARHEPTDTILTGSGTGTTKGTAKAAAAGDLCAQITTATQT